MPKADFPTGALIMLILRVLQNGRLHGYAIAQRIRLLSADVLQVEEGSLYPALQRILAEGWATAAWGASDTGRRVRFYTLSAAGRRQLAAEVARHEAASAAISEVLKNA
jgi:PadR family transcriptional regulator, regulatory protein PadR